jgi:6-phosphogluconolactonase (cycloisomerase 2 family)
MIERILTAAAAAAVLMAGATNAFAEGQPHDALVLTASNATTNELLVLSAAGTVLRRIPTQGQGGVSGNAGGIAASHDRVAVVNFGSSNVSIFQRDDGGRYLRLERVIPTLGSPVSVAFGNDHVYVLTTTHVESHRSGAWGVLPAIDGQVQLLHADASAAQVGVIKGELILTEKSNAIESVKLAAGGAVSGVAKLVAAIPANVDAPFGLATRGDEAYVTVAHADEISLVRNDTVLTVTPSVTQHAPCWVALDGPFLFSANSPSQTVSRYAVYGQKLVQDAAVIAHFTGNPTDITVRGGVAAVVDAAGTTSRVSIFKVDEDGNFTQQGVAALSGATTNGVAIVDADDWR